jgi:two-component system invasion response regulator UvrY
MHDGAAFALKAFEAGALGYVTKSSDAGELVRSVRIVAKGGRALSSDIAREIAAERLAGERSLVDDLGPRETEILRLIASGLTSGEIALLLNLSQKTVQNHHYQIKSKIGTRTDAHLVWLAIGAGLVSLETVS